MTDSFPRQQARTQGFSLGVPRSFQAQANCFVPLRPALFRTAALMSVSMNPGATAFTVTPRLASSTS